LESNVKEFSENFCIMKKSLFVAAVAALALVSCGGDKKVEEKAETGRS